MALPGFTECDRCGGSGKQRWCSLCKEPHRSIPPFLGCVVGDKPCPDCVAGLQPDPAIVEAGAMGLADWLDAWYAANDIRDGCDRNEIAKVPRKSPELRNEARAVLLAYAREVQTKENG